MRAKRYRIPILLICVSLMLPAHAMKKRAKFDEGDRDGVIALEVAGSSLAERTFFTLEMVRFDPESKNIKMGDVLWRTKSFDRFKATDSGLISLKKVKPGHYIIGSFSMMEFWTACYHAETFYFKVNPGEITYIGQFDPTSSAADLNKEITRTQRLEAKTYLFFHDNIRAPVIVPPETELNWRTELSSKISAHFPKVHAPMVLADLKRSDFPIRIAAFNEKLCF